MVEKFNRNTFKRFILVTKITPVLIALVYLITTILSFIGISEIPLNQIGGVSLIPILYLYIASYTFHLCAYHRMFLHYSVIINAINCYDYYIGIPISSKYYIAIIACITIVTMMIIIKMKFFRV